MKVLATPAFQAVDGFTRELFQVAAFKSLGLTAGSEPSMAFGDPNIKDFALDDEGRSIKIPVRGSERLWCKRDDYPDGPVFTFLLPSDH